jgi:ABC-type dipeptide/oligopeptide/nickel transport system permease subunit
MSGYSPDDLEPAEQRIHHLLSAVPPQTLPIGFRDVVMRRIASQPASASEWIVATVLALPSLAFLGAQLALHGAEFGTAITNVMTAATSETAEAFFFIDGTTVLAVALLGVASLIAAHASIVVPARKAGAQR